MADKSFGVDQLDILGTGTPTISAPNQLNLDCNTVAISTSATVGQNLTVSANAGISSLNVTGIATVANFNATGISTIVQPADSNPMANWTITNNSNSAYRFTGPGQSGSDDNPDLYLVRGHRYIFKHNATSSHPIQIRVASGGAAYTDGVTYSNTGNNTTTDGNNLIINLQHDAPARLFYQCTAHGGMVGNIYTVGGPQVISGVLTATSFVGDGSALTNLPASTSDKIEEGNSKVEVVDTGTGEITFNLDGSEALNIGGYAQWNKLVYFTQTTQFAQNLEIADTIRHLGDTNTRIRFPAADTITAETNASEKIRIDSSGHVGIGTDNPAASLQGAWNKVLAISAGTSNGSMIRFIESSSAAGGTNTGLLFGQHDSNTYLINYQNGFLQFRTNNTQRLQISNTGAFGLSGTNYGSSGQVLTSQGSGSAPTWATGGKVLQVKCSNKPDQFNSTSTSFIDVASLSVDIAAASSTNEMLVTCHVFANCEDAAMLRLMFDSTPIGNGQAGSGADVRGFAMVRQDDGNLGSGYGIQILHTPGDTNTHTYKIQARTTTSSYAININRRADDSNYCLSSSISVMEISS